MSAIDNQAAPNYIVGIGASAGGLEALQEFFDSVPSDLGVAYVIVQHLSPDFKSMMDELLRKNTDMSVHQAEEGEELKANTVFLIPAGKLMRIAEGKIFLSDLPPDNRINLPINELFRTLAEDAQNKAIGIILSGTGSDGSRGVLALKEMGAMVVVQDPEEAKFDGMPLNAINTGSVDFVLPVKDMPDQIKRFIQHPLAQERKGKFKEHLSKNSEILDDIVALIHKRTELDFRAYKESTVSRRIEHRMSISNNHTLSDYWDYINRNPDEVSLVKQDLLIGVTQFFRDGILWDILYENIIKPLVLETPSDVRIRVWCAGCSTGEEAYSYAILFAAAIEELQVDRQVTVFASDIDQSAIAFAANGVYPGSISSEVPAEYQSKYFNLLSDNSYQVSKGIRNMVVFATHNLIQDPPFSNMNLVSCRNTLIYLQNAAQQKVMAFFHFALKVQGTLVLGSAESPGSFSVYFEDVDQKNRIYKKTRDLKVPSTTIDTTVPFQNRGYKPKAVTTYLNTVNKRIEGERKSTAIGRQAIMDEYLPPTLITDKKLKVLYSYGDTSLFTAKIRPGVVTQDLSDLLNESLSSVAISAAHQVLREKKAIVMEQALIVDEVSWSLRCFSFSENGPDNTNLAISFFRDRESEVKPTDTVYQRGDHDGKRIEELDNSLIECQKLYREALEDLDTTSEELQSSNEELMAANEELQSTNEELQSVNEELYTVNSEYQQKISELTDINNDLENLMMTTKLAVLFLTSDFKIRRFTNALKHYVNIIDFDINRDFRDLSFKSPIVGLDSLVTELTESDKKSLTKVFTGNSGDEIEVTVTRYNIDGNEVGAIVSISEG